MNRTTQRTVTRLFGAAFLLLCVVPAVRAQEPQPPVPTAAQPSIGDDKLTTVAEIYLKIFALQEDFQSKLAGAHEPQAKSELRRRADEGIQEILRARNFTPDDYRAVTSILTSNPEQRARFDKVLEELKAQSAAGVKPGG